MCNENSDRKTQPSRKTSRGTMAKGYIEKVIHSSICSPLTLLLLFFTATTLGKAQYFALSQY